MLFHRSSFLFAISCVVFSVTNVNAFPVQQQQQQPLLSTTPSHRSSSAPISTVETAFLLTESLSEYYENIIDQVMLDVSEEVLSTLPRMLSSQDDVEARQLAEKSFNRNLNFMRASLLASINPLISTDLPQIDGFSTSISAKEAKKLEATLTKSILTLNKKISHQLGLIVNAERSSSILIRQAILHNSNHNSSHKNKVVTVEWHLRKPFQINIIHEEEEEEGASVATTATHDHKDSANLVTTTTNVATETQWLYQELSTVETDLLNEFDDRVEEAVQLVMETLALDL
ncbi:hypothetical protein BDF20DRAFT_967443 [Mycotypha africana]|uniref:uncharacterized protein n=1 Tax=Mycotypha africana TaxID=64632 RepID=UPI002301B601|nr:uncharacterized protein BDF20DRAFT_967443 [Mycotypha africana]KAI8991365.1 hypothetical protein BDF20DRAFT_967443 [Mycotypha africana]